MSTMGEFSAWFWSDDFWLPPNVTWRDLDPEIKNRHFPYFKDLLWPLVFALAVLAHRYVCENHLFRAIGIRLKIPHRSQRRLFHHEALEKEFRRNGLVKYWSPDQLQRLTNDTDLSERQLRSWLRDKRMLLRPSELDKFCESGWRFTAYTSLFAWGVFVLRRKTWFYHVVDCWIDYPFNEIDVDVWWYYMLELSLNWSLLFTIFCFDVKRKDFIVMLIHHVATIALMVLSWTINAVRIGTLVLVCHDCADVLLEMAKMCRYAKRKRAGDFFILSFAITWILTRLSYYPTVILYSITVEAPQLIQYFRAYWIFNVLLSILLLLNILWGYFIFKVVYMGYFQLRKEMDDIRSSSEDELDVGPSGCSSDEDLSTRETKKAE